MAGDWIKMQHATPDKPEVMKMAKLLGMEPEQVVGHLVRVWAWADQQSLNGHALDVTEMDVDRVARHAGVAKAMREVEWMKGLDGRISFPNFDRHNGETAKKRVLDAERQRRKRSREERDDGVTREEKRREEGKTSSTTVTPYDVSTRQVQKQHGGEPANRRSRLELTELPESWRAWSAEKCPGVEAGVAFERFRHHHVAKGSLMADWSAAWRLWCSREVGFAAKPAPQAMSKQAALEARNAQVAAAWTPPADEVST